jgi:hypothetical protein
MNRLALPLGLAALLVSSSASAIKVPTGSDDLNLNINVLLQARYEGTFEGSLERSFDSDFFLRRARLQASGTAYKQLSFLIQFDNSNLGKRGTATSVGAATNPAFVQDLVVGWTPIEDITIEGGLLLTPTLRTLGYSASGGQVQIDAPTDLIFQNLDRGFRQNGVEIRGFIPGHLVHFRAGVWEGFHSAAAVTTAGAQAPAINPGGKPMIGAHVRVNLIGDETGYAFNQMYLDGKARASVGGSIQYQPRAACTMAQTAAACSVSSNPGPNPSAATVADYKFFGGDAFIDLPVGDFSGSPLEFAASASVVRWDYGDNVVASVAEAGTAANTGISRTGTGYTGEADLRLGPVAVYASYYKYGSDAGYPHAADRRKFAAGLAYFIRGQADKVTLEFTHITPGQPGTAGSIAPTSSTGGLGPALSIDAIWVQGQAAF